MPDAPAAHYEPTTPPGTGSILDERDPERRDPNADEELQRASPIQRHNVLPWSTLSLGRLGLELRAFLESLVEPSVPGDAGALRRLLRAASDRPSGRRRRSCRRH